MLALEGQISQTSPLVGSVEDAGVLSTESEAALRQLTHQRLLGYDVEYGDATELRHAVACGVAWADAAIAMADRLLARLGPQSVVMPALARRNLLMRSSALLRIGQIMMLTDTDTRRELYDRAGQLFEEALAIEGLGDRVVIGSGAKRLMGWHMKSSAAGARPSVLLIGGVEGWGMDFYSFGRYFNALGLDALLIDGPGQGDTRFAFAHFLDFDWIEGLRGAVDYLEARNPGGRVGMLGSSLGGNFAMLFTAAEPRIAACCNNGAIRVPFAMRQRKHFFPKLEAFCGPVAPERTAAVWSGLELTPERVALHCPFLLVQGGLDPLVSVEDSRHVLSWIPVSDRSMHIFADGDHCIYNRPADKMSLIGNWFVERLT
jgi:alpha-beta hydrolase superfamily lysophospholipase